MKKLNNLEEVYCVADNKLVEYNDVVFSIGSHNNDVYGNPLYVIRVFDLEGNNIIERYKGKLYRTYITKGYGLIQSYNLSNSLERIFN